MEASSLLAPSLGEVEAIARAAFDEIPRVFSQPADGVALRVVDWPPDEVLDDMDIDDAYALTGLYDGVPLTGKETLHQPTGPDVIWIFRRPILDEWIERGDVELGDLVRHVLVHELAHHFGWNDDDIAAVDRWWE